MMRQEEGRELSKLGWKLAADPACAATMRSLRCGERNGLGTVQLHKPSPSIGKVLIKMGMPTPIHYTYWESYASILHPMDPYLQLAARFFQLNRVSR